MKRTAITLAILSVCMGLSAQTMYEGLDFSTDDYIGSARSVAMGNAVTAIGADLGTIGINPAGSAVAGYSQIVLGPSLSVATGKSLYSPSTKDHLYSSKGSRTRMMVPNIGASLRFTTGNDSGLVSIAFGMTANITSNFNRYTSAAGIEKRTSMAGAFAEQANYAQMNPDLEFTDNLYYNAPYPWNAMGAYESYMTEYDPNHGIYFGTNQTWDPTSETFRLPAALRQKSRKISSGFKNDILVNLAFNISNKFYLGFNLGIPIINYNYDEYFNETPDGGDYSPFRYHHIHNGGPDKVVNFRNGNYHSSQRTELRGVYAKVGFIYLPTDNLRIGAAIKTPTALRASERYWMEMSTDFTTCAHSMRTPDWDSGYKLTSPFEFNLGAAWTFANFGLVSVDYELTNYKAMKFKPLDYDDYDTNTFFEDLTEMSSIFCGPGHSLRIGGEANILPWLSVRAGYNLITNPEKHYEKSGYYPVYAQDWQSGLDLRGFKAKYSGKDRHSLSAGFGISSGRSFFADFAVKYTIFASEEYVPYDSYLFQSEGLYAPTIQANRRLVDIVATIGWRF